MCISNSGIMMIIYAKQPMKTSSQWNLSPKQNKRFSLGSVFYNLSIKTTNQGNCNFFLSHAYLQNVCTWWTNEKLGSQGNQKVSDGKFKANIRLELDTWIVSRTLYIGVLWGDHQLVQLLNPFLLLIWLIWTIKVRIFPSFHYLNWSLFINLCQVWYNWQFQSCHLLWGLIWLNTFGNVDCFVIVLLLLLWFIEYLYMIFVILTSFLC